MKIDKIDDRCERGRVWRQEKESRTIKKGISKISARRIIIEQFFYLNFKLLSASASIGLYRAISAFDSLI